MLRLPPRSTRADTLCPYTTLFRSVIEAVVVDRSPVAPFATLEPSEPVARMVAEVDFVEARVMADKGQPGLAVIQRLTDETLVFAVTDRLLGRPIVEINVVLNDHELHTINRDDAIPVPNAHLIGKLEHRRAECRER